VFDGKNDGGDRTEVLSWGERKQKLFFGRDYPILGLGSKVLLLVDAWSRGVAVEQRVIKKRIL
jgi:hypothetical protein